MRPIEPTRLQLDADGNAASELYGDVYASRDGAVGQARAVFLHGNALPQRWAGRRQFVIVETGFGLGTNFLVAWQAWRDDPQRSLALHFVSVEKHPVAASDLLAIADGPPALAGDDALRALRRELAAQWPLPMPGLHRLEFDGGRVVLTLALGDAREVVPQWVLGADAFFLDGFAPERNPELWEPALIKALARLAREGATVATYTCARAVRDALTSAGFVVERRAGFGGKRHMLAGVFAPRWRVRRHEPPSAPRGPREAIVVGAGLSGCATVHALRRRGWTVTVLERAPHVAAQASGLPAGLLHPLLSADDNLVSQLTRAGFLLATARLRELTREQEAAQPLWSARGVLHQADDPAQEQALAARLAQWGWPAQYVEYIDRAVATQRLGVEPRLGGAWFAGAGVVAAAALCEALLRAGARFDPVLGGALSVLCGREATTLSHDGTHWVVGCKDGWQARASHVVLANAAAAPALGVDLGCTLAQIAGRVSTIEAPELANLRAGISGNGYLIPGFPGGTGLGATYEDELPGSALWRSDAQAHAGNLQRLQSLLNAPPAATPTGIFAGVRCVAPDRMPLAGALADVIRIDAERGRLRGAHLADLPRRDGLWCLVALGSRGLALALLLGESLAAAMNGEPLPLDARQAGAVDPARFLLRRLR